MVSEKFKKKLDSFENYAAFVVRYVFTNFRKCCGYPP